LPRRLTVPPRHRAALSALANLDDDSAVALINALAGMGGYQTRATLEALIPQLAPALADHPEQLVPAVLSLIGQVKYHGWTTKSLAEAAARSPDLELSAEMREVLATRLDEIMRSPPIMLTSKALDIASEYEHPAHSFRVLTDIRPVFGDDPHEPPTGAVVVSLLKVEYFTDEGTRTIFVAMDDDDIAQLRNEVERATAKAQTLRTFLGNTGLTYFPITEEHADDI
jgi:hypothetical protein